MKKNLLLATLMILSVTGVQAQDVSFGIKGGVNFSNFSGDDADMLETDGRTGFHLGLIAEIMFTENLGVQPEVLYSSQGAKSDFQMEDEFFGSLSIDEFKLDYISIPVLLKYYFIEGLSLEVGPQFSFVANSEVEASMDGVSSTEDFDDETESFDFGGALGLGYELPMGLLFQGRYVMDFNDVYTDSDFRNSVFQLSVGFKF
ncbi:MAG TPA: PorT family protein [Salinimicrobium catena]|uniref:PorT family protein n=1 Tax=Salinimicrobium catena TaxID=390640 RepID=A0A7C2R894_9FLAO|nr:PorT family protein [Salinimicrobium catena]